MTDTHCQAVAMSADALIGAPVSVLEDEDFAVTPCDELAEVPIGDFVLCVGCYEAFEAIVGLGDAALRKRGLDMLKAAFPPDSP